MNSATDSDASQTIHEELMGYGIKGGTEVKVESRPGSAAWRRSLVIITRAISVLCFRRNPDWNGSKSLLFNLFIDYLRLLCCVIIELPNFKSPLILCIV